MSDLSEKILFEYDNLFEQCDNLIALADICFKKYVSNQKSIEQKSTLYKQIALKFACRSFKSFQAICLLAREGFAQNAEMLVRGLFEDMVNLEWIKKDHEKRSLLWEKERLGRRLQWAQETHQYPEDHWNIKNGIDKDKFKKELDDFIKEHPEITGKIPDFRKRCEECEINMSYGYIQIYRPYSHMDHGGMGALNTYFEKKGIDVRLDSTPSMKGIEQPLFYALKLFASVLLDNFSYEFELLDNTEKEKLKEIMNYKVSRVRYRHLTY